MNRQPEILIGDSIESKKSEEYITTERGEPDITKTSQKHGFLSARDEIVPTLATSRFGELSNHPLCEEPTH